MKNLNKGFTMIELLIVIAIIGILATTITPKLLKEMRKATVAKVQHNLGVIRSRLSLDKTLLEEFPDFFIVENIDKTDLLKSYSIEPTPAFTDSDGVSHGKSNKVVTPRDDTGGWFYIKETGEIYANLPNGAYTRDAEYEIWNGEDTEGDGDSGGEEVVTPTDPVGGDWDKFIEGAIKEGTSIYGSITFNFPNEFTIAPQEWHGDSNNEYWEKVFVYDENYNLIPNPDPSIEDGSYDYKEAITVDRTKKNIAILQRTDPVTKETIYVYSNPK